MEYLLDPDIVGEEEVYQPLEIDPGLLLRKDHLSWLFGLINSLPGNNDVVKSEALHYNDVVKSESLHFCVSCSRYLTQGEDALTHRHQPAQGPHHLFPLIRVQARDRHGYGLASHFYVSVQALQEIQVPIGDVLSHVLPHPSTRPRADGKTVARCMYVHPQNSKEPMWHGEAYSGRCAYRECEKIFSNRQSHLRLYGITPQFCSISCKLNTWLCCNK